MPSLPKLKLGLKGKGMGQRSKSAANLQSALQVPAAAKPRSATSSPHAASSAGSEPVRIE